MIVGPLNAGKLPHVSTGYFPDAHAGDLLDKSRMPDETFIDRLDRRLKELGRSDRSVSLDASGKPDLIRDIRRKGTKPKQDLLVALAEALETSVEYLLYGSDTGHVVAGKSTGYDGATERSPFTRPSPRDIPVYGTVLGGDVVFDGDNEHIETHLLEMTQEIDWVRRPPTLETRRDVYALYVSGSSMEPRFEPGDPVIVDPKRSPKMGDDVIVQLFALDGDGIQIALIKRLVRRTARFVELRQYNPNTTFCVPIERVASVHRVLMMRDVIG